MKKQANDPFERRLQLAARGQKYPRTPQVSRAVAARLRRPPPGRVRLILRTAALVAVIVLALALAVPQVRAQIAGFFQIGVIRIFPFAAPPTPAAQNMPRTATAVGAPAGTALPTLTATPAQNDLPAALRGLAGRTTFEHAQQLVGFRIALPSYPPGLGQPDIVLYQSRIQMLVLAWLDPADPQKVRLSLHEFRSGNLIINKYEPVVVQETSVNGQYAIWAEGPYIIQTNNGDYVLHRIVEGHSLIWDAAGVTYRLETDLTLAEALKIAESIR